MDFRRLTLWQYLAATYLTGAIVTLLVLTFNVEPNAPYKSWPDRLARNSFSALYWPVYWIAGRGEQTTPEPTDNFV